MGKLAPGLVCNFRTGSVVFDEVFGLGVMSHEDEASKNAAIVFDTQPEGRQSPFINRTYEHMVVLEDYKARPARAAPCARICTPLLSC